jgi:hypothetical protein
MPNTAFLSTPGLVSLAGNPVNFKLAGRNAFTGNGYAATAQIILYKYAAFSNDQTKTITWGNGSLTLTAKTTPTAYNHIATTAVDEDILAALLQDPNFVNDFTAEIDEGALLITARKSGFAYNIEVTGNLSINDYIQVSGGDNTPVSFYKLVAKLEVDGQVLPELTLPVEGGASETYPAGWNNYKAGVADIDVADMLSEENRGHFTLIFETNVRHQVHNILKAFRMYAYEQNGIPPVTGGGSYSDTFYALQGKLENFRQGELNYLEKNVTDLLTETRMFLSFAPVTKQTDIYAPERLSWLFQNAGTYRLWATEYYSNGTVFTAARDEVVITGLGVCEFDTSYKSIRTNFDRDLVSYKVWIANSSGEAISEERTYVIDYNFFNNARYFFFKNSLGVYECMRTTGVAVKSLNVKKDFINIPYDKRFTNLDTQEKQLSATSELAYEINSGYFTDKYWADYFQQFLLSSDVYWLKKGTAYPASIRDSKNKVSEDGEYTQYATFNLVHSIHDDFTEEFIATAPISIGDFSFDFSTDYFIGSGILFLSDLQVGYFTKQGCGSGFSGTDESYIIAAGTYSSYISQQDANDKALADIAANGQNYADLHGSCIFTGNVTEFLASIESFTNPTVYGAHDGTINIIVSGGLSPYTFAWNDAVTTQNRTGLADGNYSVTVRDSLGQEIILSQELQEPVQLYWNTVQTWRARKNNCGSGYYGSIETMTALANTFSSTISVDNANALALAYLQANAQAYANSVGTCELYAEGTLDIIKDAGAVFQLDITYSDQTTQMINQNTPNPVDIKQMAATLLLTGSNIDHGYFQPDTNDRVNKNTNRLYTFTTIQHLVIV